MYGRLTRTLTALFWGTGQEVVFQFLAALIWIRFWGPSLYAEWLMLSLVPTLLLRGNTGVFHSATSELITLFRRENLAGARATLEVLHTSQRLFLAGVATIYAVLAFAVALFLRSEYFGPAELALTALVFSTQFALFQWQQTALCLAKAAGLAPAAVMWQNHFRLAFIVAVLGAAPFLGPIPCTTIGVAAQFVVALATRSRFHGIGERLPEETDTLARMNAREMTLSGLQFSLFPFGQTAVHTAAVWAIGLSLGPLAAAAFHNMRTISRSVVLVARAFEHAVRLELSGLFAQPHSDRPAKLLKNVLGVAAAACTTATAILLATGEILFGFITHGELTYRPGVFALLCSGALAYSMAQVYLSVAFALNRQEQIAERYLVTLILMLAAVVPAAGLGMPSLAAVILVAEASILLLARTNAMGLMREAKVH